MRRGSQPGRFSTLTRIPRRRLLATALGAAKLVILTDVEGLYAAWPDKSSLISSITNDEPRTMSPTLESGMIPKMGACLKAVDEGVAQAHIVDGREAHSMSPKFSPLPGLAPRWYPRIRNLSESGIAPKRCAESGQ